MHLFSFMAIHLILRTQHCTDSSSSECSNCVECLYALAYMIIQTYRYSEYDSQWNQIQMVSLQLKKCMQNLYTTVAFLFHPILQLEKVESLIIICRKKVLI